MRRRKVTENKYVGIAGSGSCATKGLTGVAYVHVGLPKPLSHVFPRGEFKQSAGLGDQPAQTDDKNVKMS